MPNVCFLPYRIDRGKFCRKNLDLMNLFSPGPIISEPIGGTMVEREYSTRVIFWNSGFTSSLYLKTCLTSRKLHFPLSLFIYEMNIIQFLKTTVLEFYNSR